VHDRADVHHHRGPAAVEAGQGQPQGPGAVGHVVLAQVVVHALEQLVGDLPEDLVAGRGQRRGDLPGRGLDGALGVGEQVDVLGRALHQAVDQPGDTPAEHEPVFLPDGQRDGGDVGVEIVDVPAHPGDASGPRPSRPGGRAARAPDSGPTAATGRAPGP
jgi:hypothetical protein